MCIGYRLKNPTSRKFTNECRKLLQRSTVKISRTNQLQRELMLGLHEPRRVNVRIA